MWTEILRVKTQNIAHYLQGLMRIAISGICSFVLAHLEKWQYLEYILIEENELSQAR